MEFQIKTLKPASKIYSLAFKLMTQLVLEKLHAVSKNVKKCLIRQFMWITPQL